MGFELTWVCELVVQGVCFVGYLCLERVFGRGVWFGVLLYLFFGMGSLHFWCGVRVLTFWWFSGMCGFVRVFAGGALGLMICLWN